MKKSIAITFMSAILASCASQIIEWEHGFKTKNVIATRYYSPTMGFNIGFRFPTIGRNYDRVEIGDYLSAKGCNIIDNTTGESFTFCKGVNDKESANKKLKAILPGLDKVVRGL